MRSERSLLLFGTLRATDVLRAQCAGVALVCAAAVAVPGSVELVFGSDLSGARQPEIAARAIVIAFAVVATIFAAVACWWNALSRVAVRFLDRLTALSQRDFITWVVVGGAAVRLAVATVRPDVSMLGDGSWFHTAAASLAGGAGLRGPDGSLTAFRPPGYPWLLSLTYRWFGHNPDLTWFWATLATVLLVLSAYRIAIALYGPQVARITALGLALYPALALSAGHPNYDLLFTAGLTALLAELVTRRRSRLTSTLTLGLGFGLLALVRSDALAFVGVVLLARLVTTRAAAALIPYAVVLGCAISVPLVPWLLRNEATFGHYVLATNVGANLLIGNHPGATGGFVMDAAVLDVLDAPGTETDINARATARAWQFVAGHPTEFVQLLPRKAGHLLLDAELTQARWLFSADGHPAWLKYSAYTVAQLAYTCLASLLLVRFATLFAREQRPQGLQWLGYAVGATVVVISLVTFGQDRFRMPLLPWMIMEAAVMCLRLREPYSSASAMAPSPVSTRRR